MGKIYTNPFDWDFSDDKTLIFVDNNMDKAKVEEAIQQALSDFDIKLEGQDLLYKLIVNGQENGSINIPEDQFLKSATYDSENKKFTFVVGDTTIDVNAEDLFEGLATSSDIEEINEKNSEQDAALENLATKEELNEVDAKFVDYMTAEDINTALALKADTDSVYTKEEIDNAGYLTEHQDISNLATKAEVEAVDTKVDAIEIPDVSGFAVKTEVETALANKANVGDSYTKAESDEKYVFATNLATVATSGSYYDLEDVPPTNRAFHSEWPTDTTLEDFCQAVVLDATAVVGESYLGELRCTGLPVGMVNGEVKVEVLGEPNHKILLLTVTSTNLSPYHWELSYLNGRQYGWREWMENIQLAEVATSGDYNDLQNTPIIPDVSGFAVKTEVDTSLAEKADADDVYTKTESDETFQPLGEYVPVEDYNELLRKFASLENYVNIFIKDREEKMDEIISNMSADNKEVVIETPMESIVVPETTVAYSITAPLADNSTVELTSNKYAYIINTSEEPVSTSISHQYNDETSATTVYLSGQFDTLTLENITIGSSSSIEPATVNAVEIPQTNHQNITLALNFNDGATITNNSEYAVTINNKGEGEGALTIVAPNSTVTLNNGSYTTLNAEVSDNTLVIKKIAHIKNLNVTKGNVKVEVGRASAIANVVENYTVADGYSLDYIHGEITSANVSKLTSEGTWTLAEDINKSGRFAPGIFASDDIVWNLNGHDITFTNTQGYANFLLRGSLQLEINGNGTVTNNAGDYGFWAAAEGVKVVINGGTYYAATHVLYAEKGTIEVNGGEFHLTDGDTADKDANGNFKFLLNCKDENYRSGIANIIVRGGKFYDFDPANCAAEGVGTSFVAEGYGSVMTTEIIDGVEHKVYTVQQA